MPTTCLHSSDYRQASLEIACFKEKHPHIHYINILIFCCTIEFVFGLHLVCLIRIQLHQVVNIATYMLWKL